MKKDVYQPLDMNILNGKTRRVVSSEQALKDVSIIEWSSDVLAGERKVEIKVTSKR